MEAQDGEQQPLNVQTSPEASTSHTNGTSQRATGTSGPSEATSQPRSGTSELTNGRSLPTTGTSGPTSGASLPTSLQAITPSTAEHPSIPSETPGLPSEAPSIPSEARSNPAEPSSSREPPSENQSIPRPSLPDADEILSQRGIDPVREMNANRLALTQIKDFLNLQLEKCDFFKSLFERRGNVAMANKFETLQKVTARDLAMLKEIQEKADGSKPRFNFEKITVTCVPTNIEIKEKELQIHIKVSDLSEDESPNVYAIGEFEFPFMGEETLLQAINRRINMIKIDSSFLVCCSSRGLVQIDLATSTDVKPFYNLDDPMTSFNKPLVFFVDKGKSRTHKRKFKAVKITFFEKTSFLRRDRKLGQVQVKVDDINDKATIVTKMPLTLGRRQSKTTVELTVKVRQPLVDKTIKIHEEEILTLT